MMPVFPASTEEHNQASKSMRVREFQRMLEGLDEGGESGQLLLEKKRRLSGDQVKALEKNFEVENKLYPERKVELAHELGLQPRQVAVWFQNRRARWKTKQLERDHGVLKASFDALKLDFEKLQLENDALLRQIRDLKSKLHEDGDAVKEEGVGSDTGKNVNLEGFKGASDSDSSAVLNEDNNNSPTAAISSMAATTSQFSDNNTPLNCYQPVKIEENDLLIEEESCSTFFCDDQAPTLHWYTSEEWN